MASELNVGKVAIGGGGLAASANLQVHEAGSGDCRIVISNDTTGVGDTAGFRVGIEADEGATIMNHSNAGLNIGTNGSSALTISSSGVVSASNRLGVEDATYSCMLYPNYTGGIAGFNLNAASNGFAIYDNTVERFKIDNTGVASFSGGRIKLGTTGELDKQLIAGQLPASGPSAGNTFTFNFTFAGTYGMALITLDICGGIYETAAGRYTFHVNSKAGSGLTTALSKAATTVFEHNLGSFTFADSGATNNKFSIAVTRTETSENWSSGWGSYALDVTSNARALTLDSVAIS